ncbi:MAG: hypothetical protein G01um101448_511 [Parcubacteria group bacterium Gr01-1014_48]|nr:MAG: hypothetical protein Greene041614_193 [Parcubacteria group bacterium Greene0416_14]TSC73822.1 MAG: hypothetical protein G01um101448_511 [Parcubacteria group bacterium Gr01-1014_48]TSD01203.1 MAG: hypothetical protein Greene101415_398 [Parcubacteria group bacterium Greene1014_15]TSD08040.1 MAG: hypothetical protein Greene07144_463 [Parcubacteria group bacterium Greene0714_4]
MASHAKLLAYRREEKHFPAAIPYARKSSHIALCMIFFAETATPLEAYSQEKFMDLFIQAGQQNARYQGRTETLRVCSLCMILTVAGTFTTISFDLWKPLFQLIVGFCAVLAFILFIASMASRMLRREQREREYALKLLPEQHKIDIMLSMYNDHLADPEMMSQLNLRIRNDLMRMKQDFSSHAR